MIWHVADAPAPNPDLVTPGVWGFVVTFGFAVVVVLLIIDMVRRIRRVRYREDISRRLDAEQRDAEQRDAEQGEARQGEAGQHEAGQHDAERRHRDTHDQNGTPGAHRPS